MAIGLGDRELISDLAFLPIIGVAALASWYAGERAGTNADLRWGWRLISLGIVSYGVGTAGQLEARIVGAVDAFDAMISDRPYRKRMGREEARKELRSCAGMQFDPDVVAALDGLIDEERADEDEMAKALALWRSTDWARDRAARGAPRAESACVESVGRNDLRACWGAGGVGEQLVLLQRGAQ